jgi:hypothetical protein
MAKKDTLIVLVEQVQSKILFLRGEKVIVDSDLAALYGVPTKRLDEQIKRNHERFPPDFMFQLTKAEKYEVVANCDHLQKLKFSPVLPYAFTRKRQDQAKESISFGRVCTAHHCSYI